MGTQFSSRLSHADSKRVLKEILKIAEDLASPKRRRAPLARPPAAGRRKRVSRPKVAQIPPGERQRFGDLAVGAVLVVAESRNFFDDFARSSLFEEVLNWLKRLRSDAEYNGFLHFIKEYDLGQSLSPTAVLNKKLHELTMATELSRADRFRVAISSSAIIVLATAASTPITSLPNESAARHFGRQLAELDLKVVVFRFVARFVHEVVSSVIHRADPNQGVPLVQEAASLAEVTANRIAKRIQTRVTAEGKLKNSAAIHRIVIEELKDFVERMK